MTTWSRRRALNSPDLRSLHRLVCCNPQVEQAARQIFRSDAVVWLVLGDRSKLEPQLRKAGIAYRVLTVEG